MNTSQALKDPASGRLQRLCLIKPGEFDILVTCDPLANEMLFQTRPYRFGGTSEI